MTISGSLQDFSLPEIFQVIQNGSKSGRLSVIYHSESIENQKKHNNFLWFKNGSFVGLSKPSNSQHFRHQHLIGLMRQEKFLSAKKLVQLNLLAHKLNIPLGEYCQQKQLLDTKEINYLFNKQLEIVYLLFELDRGHFIFEEADKNNLVSQEKQRFPFMEMTGRNCPSFLITLKAMRALKHLNRRLVQQIPEFDSGLIKLVDRHNFKLLPIEVCLWNDADCQTSLKKIAQKTLFDLRELQKAALRLTLIGLVEEITITEFSSKLSLSASLTKKQDISSQNNIVSTKTKERVSSSLLGNLVSFLRNNF